MSEDTGPKLPGVAGALLRVIKSKPKETPDSNVRASKPRGPNASDPNAGDPNASGSNASTSDAQAALNAGAPGDKASDFDKPEDSGDPIPSGAKAAVTGLWVGIVTLVLFLRLFAVAGWNWEIAASVVDSMDFDDAISIFLGTLFERPVITGILVGILLPAAVTRDYWLAQAHALKTRANNGFVIFGLIVAAYVLVRTFQMWWLVWMILAITVILIAASLIWRKGIGREILSKVGKHMGFLLAATLLYLAVSVNTPWMSKERIETDVATYYAYVLESDPGFLKVLTDDREVLIFPDSDVKSRTIIED